MPPFKARVTTLFLSLALFLLLHPRPVRGETTMVGDSLRFLALGDSYTIGEQVEPPLRWPAQLARMVRARGVPLEDPLIVARTGWTTDELARGIRDRRPQGPFHLVSVLIGVNNQYRGRGLEEYRRELRDLLEQAIAFAGDDPGRVIALSIPDWGVMPFAEGRDREKIGGEIDAFNRVKAGEAEALGISLVDVTGISREVAGRREMAAPDGLHPGGAQYTLWAREALPVVLRLLRDRGSGPGEGGASPDPAARGSRPSGGVP